MSGADGPIAVWVNGVPGRALDALDRGLHFGDGLFETIACPGGQPRLLEWHLERLAAGAARLQIALPEAATLAAEIGAAAAGRDDVLVKLIVTRGRATARGYGARGDEEPTRLVLRYPWPEERPEYSRKGVAVRIASLTLGENPVLAGLKHLNRLEQVLARSEWSDPELSEALLFSSCGRLISGTMSNVFLVHENRLATPRLDRCGVAGVMRRAVLEVAQRAGIAATERELVYEDLTRAAELFLTNARIGIWPVRCLEGRVLDAGPLTRHLQALLAARLQRGAAP